MSEDRIKKILYGGDYNPEQWPEDVWEEDMRLLKEAHINIVTLNVFSWAALQPSEEEYDFSKLDRIMELVKANGLNVFMATSTAAHPAWMARKYPDILRVEQNGMKRRFGARHNSCPNSPTYRRYAAALVTRLAERYKDYGNILAWHISNEYGGMCYCDNCAAAFRVWLKKRYGSIENLNKAFNTSFWSHTFYDFNDIVPADLRSEEFEMWDGSGLRTNFQGISLDYMRFMSDSILDCYKLERDILKKITPNIPCSTNFMGWHKGLDYEKWSKEMDFLGWDNYPESEKNMHEPAAMHDLVRSLGGGKPFWLMEQTPGVSNWHSYCRLKRPGVMRLMSYQALAHGSDTVMFFQMRRSIGACEKYHSAIIDHVGTDETRVFREAAELGAELEKLGDQTLGTGIKARVAIVFDWDNWWATEMSAGPSRLINYRNEVNAYYKALWKMNIPVDFIPVDGDMSSYDLVIAPLLYMNKEGYDDRVRDFITDGGTYLTTYFSGYVNENDIVILGGYPGKQKDIIGAWVEESDALAPQDCNAFEYKGREYPAGVLCDIMHTRGAEVLAEYKREFYAGSPAVIKNSLGKGKSYYVGTHSDDAFYDAFLADICGELGISPLMQADTGIEITCREDDNSRFFFIMNHNDTSARAVAACSGTDLLTGSRFSEGEKIEISPKGVIILKA